MMTTWWRGWGIGIAVAAASVGGAAEAAPVETYQLLVFSDAKPGMGADFNRWYDTDHLIRVVALPGMVEGRRYEIASSQLRPGAPPPARYLALYTIRTSNLPAVFAEMNRRIKAGETRMNDALDVHSLKGYTYRAIRPPLYHKGARQVTPTDVQLVFTDPKSAEQEETYNGWYDATHAPDVVAVPGFLKGQRFASSEVQMATAGPTKYLVRFDIATDDLAATLEGFRKLAPTMKMSPSFGSGNGYTYHAIGPVETHAAALKALGRRH